MAEAVEAPSQPSSPSKAKAPLRLDTAALDGLRGFASFHIALGHMFILARDTHVEDLFGATSISLFYMLSGFIMTLGYAQKPLRPPQRGEKGALCCLACDECCCFGCDKGYFCPWGLESPDPAARVLEARPFIRKRLARLAPLYYISHLVGIWSWVEYSKLMIKPGLRFIYYCVGAGTAITWSQSWIIPPATPSLGMWTVSTMFFFYLVFPAIAPRLQRVPRQRLRSLAMIMYAIQCVAVLGSCAVAVPILGEHGLWFARAWPPFRLPVFVMGCCGAYCALERIKAAGDQAASCEKSDCRLQASDMLFSTMIVLFIGLAAVGHLEIETHWELDWRFSLRILVEPLIAIVLFELVIMIGTEPNLGRRGPTVRFLSSRAMTFLGEISMSVYMIHAVLAKGFALVVNPRPEGDIWDLGTPTKEMMDEYRDKYLAMPPWGGLVVMPASLVLGWVLTQWVEKPCADKLRAFDKKRPVEKGEVVGNPVFVAKKDSA